MSLAIISGQALVSEDPKVIQLTKSYFEVLWANSTLVKGSDGKKSDNIEEIESYAEKKDIAILSENFNKICIDKKKPLALRKIAEEIVQECRYALESIMNGHIQLAKEEFDKLLILTLNTSKNIKCTSYLQNIAFWGGEHGKKIMEINEKLIKKGVIIIRVFILKKAELENPLLKEVMRTQLIKGINVKFVLENELTKDLLFDFSIHDDLIVFEQLLDASGLLIGNNVSCDNRSVNKYNKIFKEIDSKAQSYSPTSS